MYNKKFHDNSLDLDQPTIPGNLSFVENAEISLSCTTLSNPSVTGYVWYKDGVVIDNETNSIYKIAKSTRSDAGVYSCQVTNGILTNKSADFPVVVSCKFY